MSYREDYDFAYSEAHNAVGLRDGAQLHNVARAFAALREKGLYDSWSESRAVHFSRFWKDWDGCLIVPTNCDGLDWIVESGPPRHYKYHDGPNGRPEWSLV